MLTNEIISILVNSLPFLIFTLFQDTENRSSGGTRRLYSLSSILSPCSSISLTVTTVAQSRWSVREARPREGKGRNFPPPCAESILYCYSIQRPPPFLAPRSSLFLSLPPLFSLAICPLQADATVLAACDTMHRRPMITHCRVVVAVCNLERILARIDPQRRTINFYDGNCRPKSTRIKFNRIQIEFELNLSCVPGLREAWRFICDFMYLGGNLVWCTRSYALFRTYWRI